MNKLNKLLDLKRYTFMIALLSLGVAMNEFVSLDISMIVLLVLWLLLVINLINLNWGSKK